MKAVVFEKYGGPEVLQLRDIAKPVAKKDEVLVKIHSTTVTAADWRMRRANPFIARLFSGLFRPTRIPILGFELAGTVVEVGDANTKYKIGDKVFGSTGNRFGAYAEFRSLPQTNLAIIPENVSFDQAAAIPIGGITALHYLRKAGISSSQKVLIYGASGSVGTYAIQLAKYYGAEVTAICSAKNIELVKSIGADHTIDYTEEDFTKREVSYDIIFDAVGKTSKRKCKNLLKQSGKYTSVNQGIARRKPGDLELLIDLVSNKKLTPVIDKTYSLDQVVDAHKYVETFRKRGNVIVRVMSIWLSLQPLSHL